EPEAQSEAPFALIVLPSDANSRRDRADPVQCPDRAIRIERHIGDVRRRIGKVRRVGHVETFSTQLHRPVTAEAECAKHAHIQIRRTRPPEADLTRIAESYTAY